LNNIQILQKLSNSPARSKKAKADKLPVSALIRQKIKNMLGLRFEPVMISRNNILSTYIPLLDSETKI